MNSKTNPNIKTETSSVSSRRTHQKANLKGNASSTTMSVETKRQLIDATISHLSFAAKHQKKPFDCGDVFLSLCFKSGDDLVRIAKLAGV